MLDVLLVAASSAAHYVTLATEAAQQGGVTDVLDAMWRYAGPFLGFGIAWGTTRSEMKELRREVTELKKANEQLSTDVRALNKVVTVLEARDEWESETKKHQAYVARQSKT